MVVVVVVVVVDDADADALKDASIGFALPCVLVFRFAAHCCPEQQCAVWSTVIVWETPPNIHLKTFGFHVEDCENHRHSGCGKTVPLLMMLLNGRDKYGTCIYR